MTQDTQTQIAAIERALQARRGELRSAARGEWSLQCWYEANRIAVVTEDNSVAAPAPFIVVCEGGDFAGRMTFDHICAMHNREAASIDYAEATLAKWKD